MSATQRSRCDGHQVTIRCSRCNGHNAMPTIWCLRFNCSRGSRCDIRSRDVPISQCVAHDTTPTTLWCPRCDAQNAMLSQVGAAKVQAVQRCESIIWWGKSLVTLSSLSSVAPLCSFDPFCSADPYVAAVDRPIGWLLTLFQLGGMLIHTIVFR